MPSISTTHPRRLLLAGVSLVRYVVCHTVCCFAFSSFFPLSLPFLTIWLEFFFISGCCAPRIAARVARRMPRMPAILQTAGTDGRNSAATPATASYASRSAPRERVGVIDEFKLCYYFHSTFLQLLDSFLANFLVYIPTFLCIFLCRLDLIVSTLLGVSFIYFCTIFHYHLPCIYSFSKYDHVCHYRYFSALYYFFVATIFNLCGFFSGPLLRARL